MKVSSLTGILSYFGLSAGSGETARHSSASSLPQNSSTDMASCVTLPRYPKRKTNGECSRSIERPKKSKSDDPPMTGIKTEVKGKNKSSKSKGKKKGAALCSSNGPGPSETYSFLDCKKQLMRDFDRIYAHDILRIMEFHKGIYSTSYQSLSRVMEEFTETGPAFGQGKNQMQRAAMSKVTLENDEGTSQTFQIPRMMSVRKFEKRYVVPLLLRPEVEFIRKIFNEQKAEATNEQTLLDETLGTDPGIECVCCYGECAFESMSQCLEGHLACIDCLNSFSREAAFGNGKVELKCMAPDCPSLYPRSELRRCLSSKIWHKLEERAREENLNMAGLEDLVRCPYCDFAAILPSEEMMFVCQMENCQRAICRRCKNEWIGYHERCPALEKPDETALRVQQEEQLTLAQVRTCINCKAQFIKDYGCNKMTCRCGTTMCFVCSTPNIDYTHFCAHPRDPGQPCKQCNACSLWKQR